jgi:hypothetical protein
MKRLFVELLSHSHTQDTTVALRLPLNADGNKNHFQNIVIFTLKTQELDKVQKQS